MIMGQRNLFDAPKDLIGGQIVLGDCLTEMLNIPDKSIDMILCDLPYGTTKCKWDVIVPFEPLWLQYKRIIKNNGAIVLFGTEPFSSRLRLSNLDWFRYDWYWEKNRAANFLFGNRMPLKTVETASVFYSGQPVFNSQKTMNPKGSSKRHLGRNPSKISISDREIMGESWKETLMDDTQNYHGKDYEPDKLLAKQLIYFKQDPRKTHPTQKPVALCEYLIRTYTHEKMLVLDNCAGSGTTGVACMNTGRDFILIEKEQKYVDMINERLKAANKGFEPLVSLKTHNCLASNLDKPL